MKKSVIGFLALGIFVLGLSGCKGKKAESGKEVIRVAVEGTWKPYNYVDENGVLTGYDIDAIKAVSEKIPNVELKFEPTSWDGMLLALETDRYDIVLCEVKKNPERAKRYLYSDIPYNYDYPAIAFKDTTDIKSAQDLLGKTVIVGAGSSYQEWIDSFNSKNGGKVNVLYAGNDSTTVSIFTDVIQGRADATLDSPVAIENLKKDQGWPLKAIPADPDLITPTYFVYARSKRGEYVQSLFDKALKEVRDEGTLSKLALKWFGVDTISRGN